MQPSFITLHDQVDQMDYNNQLGDAILSLIAFCAEYFIHECIIKMRSGYEC